MIKHKLFELTLTKKVHTNPLIFEDGLGVRGIGTMDITNISTHDHLNHYSPELGFGKLVWFTKVKKLITYLIEYYEVKSLYYERVLNYD